MDTLFNDEECDTIVFSNTTNKKDIISKLAKLVDRYNENEWYKLSITSDTDKRSFRTTEFRIKVITMRIIIDLYYNDCENIVLTLYSGQIEDSNTGTMDIEIKKDDILDFNNKGVTIYHYDPIIKITAITV